MLATHAGAKAIGEKVLQNSVVNTEPRSMPPRRSPAPRLPEAARLQANVQQQLAVASSQTRLFELSTKVAKQTFETLNVAATKSFDQLKKAS